MKECTLGVYEFASDSCQCNSCREEMAYIAQNQFKRLNTHEIAEKKVRRERIVTAIMAGIYANPAATANHIAEVAARAVCGADALIDLLDEVKK